MRRTRTSREVLRLLAQLAGAVVATHAEEGVHRDVKGDNALVLEAGTRAMLVDFGSASIRRAPRLTWQQPPPGHSPVLESRVPALPASKSAQPLGPLRGPAGR